RLVWMILLAESCFVTLQAFGGAAPNVPVATTKVFAGGITTPAFAFSSTVSLPALRSVQPAYPDDVQPLTVTVLGGLGFAGAFAISAQTGPAASIAPTTTNVLIIADRKS